MEGLITSIESAWQIVNQFITSPTAPEPIWLYMYLLLHFFSFLFNRKFPGSEVSVIEGNFNRRVSIRRSQTMDWSLVTERNRIHEKALCSRKTLNWRHFQKRRIPTQICGSMYWPNWPYFVCRGQRWTSCLKMCWNRLMDIAFPGLQNDQAKYGWKTSSGKKWIEHTVS